MQTNIYTLPELNFVGGEAIEIYFHILRSNGEALDITGAKADFAVCDYSAKDSDPLLHYDTVNNSDNLKILADEGGVVSLVYLMTAQEAMVDFFGKYVYQLTITDASGRTDVRQGIMNITRNIHQDFITSPPTV